MTGVMLLKPSPPPHAMDFGADVLFCGLEWSSGSNMICSAEDQYDVKGCRGPRGHTALCSGVQGTGVSGCGGEFETQ